MSLSQFAENSPITRTQMNNIVDQVNTNETEAAKTIGVNQSWQSFSGSRSLDTEYTNSEDKPIQVSIVLSVSDSLYFAYLVVDGLKIGYTWNTSNSGAVYPTLTAIIPSGSTYEIETGSGSWLLVEWHELR